MTSLVLGRITMRGDMKTTADYGLRVPELRELHAVFGSYRATLKKTGGEIKIACFYIANPHLACKAPDCHEDGGSPITRQLVLAADDEDVRAAWEVIPDTKRKRPVSELMRRTKLSRCRVNDSLGRIGVRHVD